MKGLAAADPFFVADSIFTDKSSIFLNFKQ